MPARRWTSTDRTITPRRLPWTSNDAPEGDQPLHVDGASGKCGSDMEDNWTGYGGAPLGFRRSSEGVPLNSGGDFSRCTVSPPRPCLSLTAFIRPLFK